MSKTIGVLAVEHVALGVVEDHKLVGKMRLFPENVEDSDALLGMPADAIVQRLLEEIEILAEGEPVQAVGVGFPGIIRDGLVEESPNLKQIKGTHLASALTNALGEHGQVSQVSVFNDADVTAAGLAASLGHLDRLIRVWTLGNGIGFGRYPCVEGTWEGGHSVVTLDPKEKYCGCGGVGHLEGIMGTRAMRMRFLDLEPEEVFAHARQGDGRCVAFVKMWHRALAAATATSIHMDGPGKFFITGANAHHLDAGLLQEYVMEMVKMSPLQGSSFQVVPTSDEIGIVGAAVNATRDPATKRS